MRTIVWHYCIFLYFHIFRSKLSPSLSLPVCLSGTV